MTHVKYEVCFNPSIFLFKFLNSSCTLLTFNENLIHNTVELCGTCKAIQVFLLCCYAAMTCIAQSRLMACLSFDGLLTRSKLVYVGISINCTQMTWNQKIIFEGWIPTLSTFKTAWHALENQMSGILWKRGWLAVNELKKMQNFNPFEVWPRGCNECTHW